MASVRMCSQGCLQERTDPGGLGKFQPAPWGRQHTSTADRGQKVTFSSEMEVRLCNDCLRVSKVEVHLLIMAVVS